MHIARIETTDGHLRDVALQLTAELNCIIGARGTCKSTIVETIRFVFNDDPTRVAELLTPAEDVEGPAHRGLIRATLAGGTGRLDLAGPSTLGDGSTATVERDTSSHPRVYIDGVKAVDESALLSEIEVYSQGELQEIAISPAKRLALVDRPHKAFIDELEGESRGLAEEIARLGPQIRELRESVESARRTLHEGGPLRQEFAAAQASRPAMSPQMAEGRARFQERDALQKRAESALASYQAEAEEIRAAVTRMESAASTTSNMLTSASPALARIAQALADAVQAANELLSRLPSDEELGAAQDAARAEFEKESAAYYELLREEEAVTEAIKREDRLGEEVRKLERVESELVRHESQLAELEEQRSARRAQLRDLRTRIFHRRLDEVERINTEFSDQIVLALNHGTHSARYRAKLDDLLAGSRLRERGALCTQIAAALPPDRLVSFVDDDDAPGLASVLNRDSGQMMRLISHLSETDDVYSLESEVADDELEITMFVDGVPRAVAEMSKGQKATAILPLVLRPARYPLVLDQPEDDLDNRFIYDTLVKQIRELKHERQLIFVTHNANIPVIGDAERVFVMGMDRPDHAVALGVGNVEEMRDEIISLLEGGEKAFELRSESYGYPPRE